MSAAIPEHDRSAVLVNFESFRAEIDDYNDRRERLIKVQTFTRLLSLIS